MSKKNNRSSVSMYRYMNTKTVLGVVLFAAFFLRIYKLGGSPPGLTQDEAALGYNAFSILKTGRDEYGEFLPMIFKSFGDYKPGLYVYLTVPFVAIFGLTEFAVRLPSALAGVAAVCLIYKIINYLLLIINKDKKKLRINHQPLAIIASFLLAINPWHVHFSRGAWEANVSLTLTLLGIYFFLRSLNPSQPPHEKVGNKNSPSFEGGVRGGLFGVLPFRIKFFCNINLILSSIFFSSTFLTYQGAKLSTIIVLFVLTIVFWRDCTRLIKENFGTVVQSTVLGLIIISPIIISMFQGQAGRLEVFSVFSHTRPDDYLQEFLDQGNEVRGSAKYYLYHSEPLNFFRGIMGRWFNHFSGKFLFFEGDWQNPRHSAPHHGMFLITDIVIFLLGIVFLIKRWNKVTLFVFLWLILSPLPAVLTKDQVQAVRALNMVIPMIIVMTFGMYALFEIARIFKRNTVRLSFIGSYAILFSFSFIYFLDAYFLHLPINNAKHWQYGYKQVVGELVNITDQEDKILFQQSYAQPYIYFLFYNQYDPRKYQQQAELSDAGIDVGIVKQLDNITFRFFSWPVNKGEFDYIVGDGIVVSEEVGEGFEVVKDIKYPKIVISAFKIVKDK